MLILASAATLDLNLKHLRALTLIAKTGSISAAANATGLSQPALSQGVARLEQQFGARLFDRMPRGLHPTAIGTTVLLRIGRAMERLAKGMRLVATPGRRHPRPELHLSIVQIRALLALAEAGSFSGAALTLQLSEPAVHRAVRQLEQLCEAVLTERRAREVGLSTAGHRMARNFSLAMSELDAALQETAQRPQRIAVGAMALSRSLLVPIALAEFSQIFKYVEVDVVDGSYGELIKALRSGVVDMVVGTLRKSSAADLRQETLLRDWITVIGRSKHPLAGRYPSLEELALYPWIVGRRTSALLERWQQIFDDASIPRPRAPIQCGSVSAIRGLLMRSDFLTLLSRDQVGVELEAGLLTSITSSIPDTLRTVGSITRRDWFPTDIQRQFMTILKQAVVQMSSEVRRPVI